MERWTTIVEQDMGRKSEMPAEKRVEVVLALLRNEGPAVQIARRAGVSEQTLYRWRDEFVAGGKAQLGAARATMRWPPGSWPNCSVRSRRGSK